MFSERYLSAYAVESPGSNVKSEEEKHLNKFMNNVDRHFTTHGDLAFRTSYLNYESDERD